MSDSQEVARQQVADEWSACNVDGNWCTAHDATVNIRAGSGNICNLFDDLLGLAESVAEAVEPLIRADERKKIAEAIEAIPRHGPASADLRDKCARIARNGGTDDRP